MTAGPDRDVALEFLRSPLAFLDATVQQYGGAVGLKLGGEHVVLLTDLTLARQVLIDQPEVFVKVCVPWHACLPTPCICLDALCSGDMHATSCIHACAGGDSVLPWQQPGRQWPAGQRWPDLAAAAPAVQPSVPAQRNCLLRRGALAKTKSHEHDTYEHAIPHRSGCKKPHFATATVLAPPCMQQKGCVIARQAMGSATRELLHGAWANSGPREVYADLNALTLCITTVALFGSDLPPAESARVTGTSQPWSTLPVMLHELLWPIKSSLNSFAVMDEECSTVITIPHQSTITCMLLLPGAIQTAFEYFADRAALGFLIPEWLPTPDNARYHQAVDLLDAAVYSIIDARQRQLAGSSSPPQVRLAASLLPDLSQTPATPAGSMPCAVL